MLTKKKEQKSHQTKKFKANVSTDMSRVDTILFDYGGVVGTHRVEPYWGRYASLLESDPKKANEYISETSPHGIAFRLGKISMEEFWEEVQKLAIRQTANGLWPLAIDATVKDMIRFSRTRRNRFGIRRTIYSVTNTVEAIQKAHEILEILK